jgi:predicted  nucleic acid-binding Zn-ribbon protein
MTHEILITAILSVLALVGVQAVVLRKITGHAKADVLAISQKITKDVESLRHQIDQRAEATDSALNSRIADVKGVLHTVSTDIQNTVSDARQHIHNAAGKLEDDAEAVKAHVKKLADDAQAVAQSGRLPRTVGRLK